MKFLCDEMLNRLGRWPRAAGYDTLIMGKGISDEHIYKKAQREHRLLLTRDRDFQKMADTNSQEPFSRCLVCNTELERKDKNTLKNIPEEVLGKRNTFWYCNNCQKSCWEGSHTNRMRKQLESWKQYKETP